MVLTLFSLIVALSAHQVYAADKVRFAVGPFQPTPGDTKKAYEPFFQHLAKAMGVEYDLVVTTDWAGIATALANGQADVAWMGPWGYVLANKEGDAQAIATVKYDGKPFYHAIIVGRPDLKINNWPDDAKGLSISFADRGSTSDGWFRPIGSRPRASIPRRSSNTGKAHPIQPMKPLWQMGRSISRLTMIAI
jgi:phosphonate transport system substrate-binding protein